MERTRGIEPPTSAWEADVLPLNYVREQIQQLLLCFNFRNLSRVKSHLLQVEINTLYFWRDIRKYEIREALRGTMIYQTEGNELLKNLNRLHTTELGAARVRKNLNLIEEENTVDWCKKRIKMPNSAMVRKGKNWYIFSGGYVITVNAYSYTIITAHKQNKI